MAKLIKNRNSLMVIIPRDVCKRLNLQAGAEVYITTTGRSIIIEEMQHGKTE